jgi:c-di-GMP-binding flagellar brake protein YcgR
MLPADPDLNQAADPTVVLEHSSPYGIARFRGHAAVERPDLVRFHVEEMVEMRQRRQFLRVNVPQPVVVSPFTRPPAFTHSIDIGGGGMLLRGPAALALDERVGFQLHLEPDTDPVEGLARVVRVTEAQGRAVMFEHIEQRERERLIHFLFARQRAERAERARTCAAIMEPRG